MTDLEGTIPESIATAAAGGGTDEQRKSLLLDLYSRLSSADPSSATAAVAAHETAVGGKLATNRNIAGSWELLDGTSNVIGSVSFDDRGSVSSELSVEAMTDGSGGGFTETEVVCNSNIDPKFSDLNVELLTYATTHQACGNYFKGELTITVLDADRFEGSLNASEEYDMSNRDPDYEPYGLSAEFQGRRVREDN